MLIITHFNPDIDAICAVWLLKKFGDRRFRYAKVDFVPAGETYHGEVVDSDPETVHVDTGMGEFDHHQIKDDSVCAASLVLTYIAKNLSKNNKEALERLVDVVCHIDHFQECLWSEADSDRYEFMLYRLVNGLKIDNELDDQGLIDFGGVCLTGVFQSLKNKIRAENDLKTGIKSTTVWGKTLFIESGNPETLHLAQKKGYNLVVRKDPKLGLVKIGARPDVKIDLDKIYQSLKSEDSQADWFFHSSGKLVLNGSSKNPNMKASSLSLTQLMEIVKKIK